jgi:arylsulfatase A-like enzyme
MSKRLLDRRWPWLLVAAVILLAFLSTVVEIRAPGGWDPRPVGTVDDIEALRQRDDLNLLFIVIDTLRAERLGSYGYARDTSPVLDRMSATGVRFARHLAQSSWTKASMASLWTGLYPGRIGITRFDHVLPEQARMPAEILAEAGFQTVGLYRNGWVAPTFGFDQGFEVYQRPVRMPLPPGVRRENPTVSDAGTDEGTVAAALEFLRVRGGKRWFLYLHLMDVHEYLYDEESALFGSDYSDIYDNSIRWVDSVVEVLLGSIAELGYMDKTLVVVGSDHGEAFGERGLEGHARKVYRETTEVPWLLFFPFRLEPGAVVETRTRNVDIWPTLLDLLGLEMPGTDGRSRVPELLASARGEALPDDAEHAIAHLDQTWARPDQSPTPTVAVSEGTLRYVRIHQGAQVIEQLYDASGDPRELRNRAREDPETVARLGGVAEGYLELRPEWGESPTREIGELELNHLRALGYALP